MLRGFGRVLLPFDGSPASTRAMTLAADIVSRWREEAEIRVLIVGGPERAAECRELARDYLDPYGLTYGSVCEEGVAASVIPAFAQSWQAGLICMGAYGHTLLREVILGSTTQAVARSWKRPLLLCP